MPNRSGSPSALSLDAEALTQLAAPLRAANQEFARSHPGESSTRQPVHTVYGGAQLFRFDSARKMGGVALGALREYARDPDDLRKLLDLPGQLADAIHSAVINKLEREPVEDFRIDFEDGYGNRPDPEEDGHAASAAGEVARGLQEGVLPPGIGLRIKPLNEELRQRSVRTLAIFLSTLLERTDGKLPPGFVITLPKITVPQQITYLVLLLERLEQSLGLEDGALRFEIMVETPQTIFAQDGSAALPHLLAAGRGRISGAHFGTYDFTASCNITAAHQIMHHPLCVFARQVMQLTLAGTPVQLSDGSTAILPVPPHRGTNLTASQLAENRQTVHAAWRRHYDDVRESLRLGFYQGWDLHPAQLVTRYAAVFAFFLEGLDAASARLRNFMDKAAQATLLGEVFDDAATGQGLLNFFLRATNSGALAQSEVSQRTGLTLDELRTRSFVQILKGRTAKG
jgi:citrate lyase beta subunit